MIKFNKRILTDLVKMYTVLVRNQGTVHKLNLQIGPMQIKFLPDTKIVSVDNGTKIMNFPATWLRDNCQCSKCFHGGSTSRIIDWELFDVNVVPTDIIYDQPNDQLQITWSDKHKSSYTIDWLKIRDFNSHTQNEYLTDFYRPAKSIWGKTDFQTILATFQYQEVLNSETVLKEWLQALTVYGVSMLKGAPHKNDATKELIERVGFVKKTHYGEEYIVAAKPGTSNVAYLSTPLQLHADLPYYEYVPGTNILHCLVQTESEGGHSLLSDGFYAAEKLKHLHPELHHVLSNTLVDWSDVGQEEGNHFHSIYRAPVICIGRDGRLDRINHSIPQRDSHFNVPIEYVQKWYEALNTFIQILNAERVTFKLKAGDIIAFDNTRLVHGRTGFTDTDDNTRYLVGAFLDWDEIYSKLRVLKTKFKA